VFEVKIPRRLGRLTPGGRRESVIVSVSWKRRAERRTSKVACERGFPQIVFAELCEGVELENSAGVLTERRRLQVLEKAWPVRFSITRVVGLLFPDEVERAVS
jgi:hypothetical protein